jgi:Ca2+/Na+ antiporter
VLFEIFALLGAMGIALLLFMVIILLGDSPIKAFISAMILMYLLITVYIYVLSMISKRIEKRRATT